jgi:hypothetical protein
MRTQSAATAKEMATATKDCMKDVMKDVKSELATALSSLKPTARTPRKRGFQDEDDEYSEGPGPVRARAPMPKRRPPARAIGGAGAVAVAAGSSGRRQQNVRGPGDMHDWKDWACTRQAADKLVDELPLTTTPKELRGLDFEETAERIGDKENGDFDEWKEWYKRTPGRTSRRGGRRCR